MTAALDPAVLAGAEAARRRTVSALALIERQITHRAARKTLTAKTKRRPRRGNRAGWTRTDERRFREYVERLSFERRADIEVLSHGLCPRGECDSTIQVGKCNGRANRLGLHEHGSNRHG